MMLPQNNACLTLQFIFTFDVCPVRLCGFDRPMIQRNNIQNVTIYNKRIICNYSKNMMNYIFKVFVKYFNSVTLAFLNPNHILKEVKRTIRSARTAPRMQLRGRGSHLFKNIKVIF